MLPGTGVTVFRSARYAAQVAKQISSQIPNNVRLKRISNALFTWVVPETPALRAAIYAAVPHLARLGRGGDFK